MVRDGDICNQIKHYHRIIETTNNHFIRHRHHLVNLLSKGQHVRQHRPGNHVHLNPCEDKFQIDLPLINFLFECFEEFFLGQRRVNLLLLRDEKE